MAYQAYGFPSVEQFRTLTGPARQRVMAKAEERARDARAQEIKRIAAVVRGFFARLLTQKPSFTQFQSTISPR